MADTRRFQELRFENFKAFKSFTVSIREMNVLVGPNNSGKSTVLAAFRILSEGIRRACGRRPEQCPGHDGDSLGWPVSLASIPVAGENLFHNYDDSKPAVVTFKLRGDYTLSLFFPKAGVCYMHSEGAMVTGPGDFKKVFPTRVAHVPILGPVEHREQLFTADAAREALLSHNASRNFRNIWWHFPDRFDAFRQMIQGTWPGMDIKPPEKADKEKLRHNLVMFACEDRIDREIYWSGFGFQVWCQMLTYVLAADDAAMLIIDEPDIYLHSDLQRQLIGILRRLKCDVMIATHSTELIAEVEPSEIVLVNKGDVRGKRVQKAGDIPGVFRALGSNARFVLTQVGKTRRAMFVEGGDFEVISGFARVLGKPSVANRSAFAVIPTGGCRPSGVRDMVAGIETALGERILSMAIFDRDYRCDEERKCIMDDLRKACKTAVVHERKELENFLLIDAALDRAIAARLRNRSERTGEQHGEIPAAGGILATVLEAMKIDVQSQWVTVGQQYLRGKNPSKDPATLMKVLMSAFEDSWANTERRRMMVSGKEAIAGINRVLENQHKISISPAAILMGFTESDVPIEMVKLIEQIEVFSVLQP